jgi:hypothetical protein
MPIALAHVCFEGEERKWRGLAAMSLNDPIAGIRQNEIPQCSDVLWLDLANVLGCHLGSRRCR